MERLDVISTRVQLSRSRGPKAAICFERRNWGLGTMSNETYLTVWRFRWLSMTMLRCRLLQQLGCNNNNNICTKSATPLSLLIFLLFILILWPSSQKFILNIQLSVICDRAQEHFEFRSTMISAKPCTVNRSHQQVDSFVWWIHLEEVFCGPYIFMVFMKIYDGDGRQQQCQKALF